MFGSRRRSIGASFDEAAGLVISIGAIVIGVLTTMVLGLVCKLGDYIKQLQQSAKSWRDSLSGKASRVGGGG